METEKIEVVCDYDEKNGYCKDDCIFNSNVGCSLLFKDRITDIQKGDTIKIEIIRK